MADLWAQTTSSAKTSRRGRVSTSARSERSRFVRLARVGPRSAVAHHDVAVEHAVAPVVGDPHVALAAGAARGAVLEEDRVVVVLVATGEVNTVEVGGRPLPIEVDPDLVTCDRTPERYHTGREAAGALVGPERREVEGALGLVLDQVVGDRCPGAQLHVDDLVPEVPPAGAGRAGRGPAARDRQW